CSLICILEAVFNPLWVFLYTGERPGLISLLGGAMVVTTIALWATLSQRNVKKWSMRSEDRSVY
ncbi:MAG: hypothetical protein FWG37_04810, partial [Clostridia bacterium]|nr:hypothetical protein [Clostridia bacterium]